MSREGEKESNNVETESKLREILNQLIQFIKIEKIKENDKRTSTQVIEIDKCF